MFKRVTLGIIVFLFVLGGALWGVFLNDETTDYVFVIPETLNVEEGDLFDLAIDSNIDANALNIISSNFSVVRLEGSQLVAQGAGSSYVTVETQDGKVQDHVLITVNPLVNDEPVEDPSFEVVLEGERFTFSEPVPISQLDAPLREGYTFMGFSLEENGTVLENDSVIDESLTLYPLYQAIEEETPEPPVVDDEDSENEDEVDEDSETPIDEDDEPSVSTPSSITVTLESDQGITMSVLTVSPGAIISAGAFDGELSEVGYFLKGETCENPFDFDTPLVTDTSIVFGETNYTSPCIELDEMATLGKLQVGETIEAFVSPSAATINYEWFISANDRDYSLLSNVTGSTLELVPEHFRQYIAVKLTGTGDYTGSLSLPLGRVGLSSQTVGSGDDGESENDSETENIEQRTTDAIKLISESAFVPINSTSALIAIGEGADYTFTATIGDEEFEIPITGSALLTQSYVLVKDIDLAGINFTQAAIGNDFENPFAGVFDGNGYTISNLNIDGEQGSYIGLFGFIGEATIENLKLDSFNLTGGAVGSLSTLLIGNSTVANITVQNAVINAVGGESFGGGLIGVLEGNATFRDIEVIDGLVKGVIAGGIIGYVDGGNISIIDVTQNGDVTGSGDNVGGIIGYVDGGNISIIDVTQNGDVTGSGDNVGGIIGLNTGNITVNDIIQTGNVTGSGSFIGGITGWTDSNITGSNISSLSNITASVSEKSIGTIIGEISGGTVNLTGINDGGTDENNYVGSDSEGHTFDFDEDDGVGSITE